MTSLPQAPSRSRWLLPLAAAAAVVVVVAVVGVASLAGTNSPTQPPVLHLASVAGGSLGLPVSSPAGASDFGVTPEMRGAPAKGGGSVIGGRGSGWRLQGTLPSGPSSGRAYVLAAGDSTSSFVRTLAAALGMRGEPQHLKGGWYLVSGTTELSVSELAGRHWTYSNHGCIAGPVLDPQTGAACAVAQSSPPAPASVKPDAGGVYPPRTVAAPDPGGAPGGSGVNSPPTFESPVPVATPIPIPENARRLTRRVLEAVGVNPDAAKIDTEGGQRSVAFSPEVAGSTVLGLETRVSVDEQGQIVDASGWLAAPTGAAAYPLISARQGYDQLLQQPQPMMALALPCRIVPGAHECAPTPDRVVTGATLGLTQAYSTDRGILLVPAWLFHVRGQSTPVAVVAVQRAFLGQPDQPSTGGSSSSDVVTRAAKDDAS